MRFPLIIVAVALIWAAPAHGHLVAKPKNDSLQAREKSQRLNLSHARYVCKLGARAHKRWSCKAVVWLARELEETREALRPPTPDWIELQIWLAEKIGPLHDDAWPNCNDPFDSRQFTWQDTVNCENQGSWYDSPGYYRCGLQFDPGWERKYHIRVCP